MKSFLLTPEAARDLDGIRLYLSSDNPRAAAKVLKALRTAMLRLARQPGLGHLREDLADRRHRFFLVFSYFVVYRAGTKPLQETRVLHAARDVHTLVGLPPWEM